MRILYLNPSGKLGGAETSLLTLLGGLRKTNPEWEQGLIVGEPGPLVEHAGSLGVDVRVLKFPGKLAGMGDAGQKKTFARTAAIYCAGVAIGIQVLQYRHALSRAIIDWKPDLVHTNGFKMHALGPWATPRGIPLVVHLHDYATSRPVAGRLLRLGIGRSAAIVTNSKSVKTDLHRLLGRSAQNVTSIYNAVDQDRFSPDGPVADLDALCGLPSAPSNVVKVGLIATFARWKGHKTFLQALSLLPRDLPFRGYIIGGPIYQTKGSQHSFDELKQEIRDLGLSGRVGLSGFLEDPVPALRALDVVVHASLAPEPFGMAIIEAMACEKAVVASNAGGASEIFQDGETALGHQAGNVAELASKIERLVQSPELRTQLGSNGRQAVLSGFCARRMALDFAALYRGTHEQFRSHKSRGSFDSPYASRNGLEL